MDEEVTAGDSPDRALPGPALLTWLEKIGLSLSAVAIVLLGLLVTVSVLGRLVSGQMIPDDIVISGELMVTLVALPWAYITADRGHISVEVFTNWISSRGHAWLDILAGIVALVMVVPLTWATGQVFLHAAEFGSYFDGDLYLPEWPGRLTFFIGFAMMTLRFLIQLGQDTRRLWRGEVDPARGHDEFF